MAKTPTRVRFAPSPTGPLHLGGLRTALCNHLYAHSHAGHAILRIEDTDAARRVPGAVDGIRAALAWAGLAFDGPHYQSQRLDLYHAYARRLLESGHAYRCFCSPDTLAATRERLARTGSNATYDKACLRLTEEDVARRVRASEKFTVRLNDDAHPPRIPAHDMVFGALRDAHASLPTDPILLKSDMFPTYHLASVVDDHEMGITHVIRGEEWLPSLPLHLDLYSCLSITPPQFAHLPLLLNPDGSKMSKRKGDVAVLDYMKRGFEPEAVVNWLALAGWGQARSSTARSPDSTAILTMPELIDQFDLASLTHRRQILEPSKLEYINKHHLMRSWKDDDGTLRHARRISHLVGASFPDSPYVTPEYIARVLHALQGRITNVHDVPHLAPYFFVEPDYTTPEAQSMLQSLSDAGYRRALDATLHQLGETNAPHVINVIHTACEASELKQKAFMTALRHALTGIKAGPTLAETIDILGQDRTVARLGHALVSHQRAT